jgi:HECT-domain (ubiquitin-transferase)
MTWFRPMTLEPLSTYELLGLIMSIGIYNGITLPTSFPWAFYAKMLGRPVDDLHRIKDGWPGLFNGFVQLLGWKNGDVQDVFTRDYVFSYEANGQIYHVDMLDEGLWKRPYAPLSDAVQSTDSDDFKPVTNKNRAEFVADYVFWLTERSIQPQFEAFQRGFCTCLDEKMLSIVTPETLQFIAEGHHDFSIDELEEATLYEEGYDSDHPFIKAFWDIAKGYSKEKQAKLLEFVTASSRVPVNGVDALHFSIVRNGPDSDVSLAIFRLRRHLAKLTLLQFIPRSQTCFGKLLIPEYSSMEKLREKMDIALEHSVGFGSI